jgi:hypothetical protein
MSSRYRPYADTLLIVFLAIGCHDAEPQPPADLPAGTILRASHTGGIGGEDLRYELTEDGLLSGRDGARSVQTRLGEEELAEVLALRAQTRGYYRHHSDGPDVADGMSTVLIFDGRGSGDRDRDVTALMIRMDRRFSATLAIWKCPSLLAGRATSAQPAEPLGKGPGQLEILSELAPDASSQPVRAGAVVGYARAAGHYQDRSTRKQLTTRTGLWCAEGLSSAGETYNAEYVWAIDGSVDEAVSTLRERAKLTPRIER